MENFELIEQYVSGKLSGEKLAEFERKLKTDAALNSEVNLQRAIIEQIQKVRASELKAMLGNTPVGTPLVGDFSALKIAASIIGAGALIAAVYFFGKDEKSNLNPQLSTSIEDSIKGTPLFDSSAKEPEQLGNGVKENQKALDTAPAVKDKAMPAEQKPTSAAERPSLDLTDPTADVSQETENVRNTEDRSPIVVSKMEIETISNNKDYSFHYQISEGKLVLFGSFDKGLYELIEINSDTRNLFLFYKEKYYPLAEDQRAITALKATEDKKLIQRLNQYRQQ